MTADLWTIGRLEFIAAARLKWIRLLSAALALLAAAAAYSAGAANDIAGADGFARTTMGLLPVVLVLVPLAALILGVSAQSCDADSEGLLFGQPVSRTVVVIGRWLGESAALAAAIVLGLAIGGATVAFASRSTEGLAQYAFFAGASVALAVIFLSIAAVVAAATRSRTVALGTATFLWFAFVLLYDGVALSLAGSLTGSVGGRVLFISVFGNPVGVIRVATLRIAGTPAVLGAAGESWVRFLGGPQGALLATLAAVSAWLTIPIVTAVALINRRDL